MINWDWNRNLLGSPLCSAMWFWRVFLNLARTELRTVNAGIWKKEEMAGIWIRVKRRIAYATTLRVRTVFLFFVRAFTVCLEPSRQARDQLALFIYLSLKCKTNLRIFFRILFQLSNFAFIY